MSSPRRMLFGLATLLLATFGMVAVTAGPASAAPAGCTATFLCLYPDPGYSGGFGHVAGNNSNFNRLPTSTHNCGNGTWNDCISSAFNDGTSCTVWLWSAAGYSGRKLSIARGTGYRNLSTVNFDDVTSSNHWCTAQ
jgi:Peptidase inhibitor family I36